MTVVAPYPITIEQVMFVRVSVIAVPGHVQIEGADAYKAENNLNVSVDADDPKKYTASMRTVLNPSMDRAHPYSIDVECVGSFRVDDTLSADDARRGVTINANSVLYGAIRESIAWITGRQPYGPLLLGFSVLQAAQPSAAPREQPGARSR